MSYSDDRPVNTNDPAFGGVAVVPSDTTTSATTLAIGGRCPRAFFIGTAGDVVLCPVNQGTNSVTFKNLPNAYILPVRAQWVKATNTSGSNIVALY